MQAETLDGLTAVVTGASSGVGAAAARQMAAMGASVVVVGRAVTRTRAVADEVGGTAFPADFARFSEVRELAQHLISHMPRIDILVNNAGIVSPKRETTSDGHELTVQVNFLSPFLLTSLLWEKLLQAPSALVINTGSSLYRFGKLNPDDLDQKRSRYAQMRSYNASKLASVVHAAEINRRAPDTMTAVAFHPGTVRSGLDRNSALITAAKSSLIGRYLTQSPEEGAEPIVRIATTDRSKLRDVFYNRLEPEPLRAPAADADLGARLWQRAHELTHAST
ncbi:MULTISPECIES: SDR family NAD(P)-dependent oxidoreductase [unclassified Streptomyces]|uniref:SDR family NAD(P)-dependent oxidoreductase n=1 Tax=unclassified Streptomyces TaxID=2593676 RepID=UPI0033F62468